MSAKKERRLRHGELITEAWNPHFVPDIVGAIQIGDQELEVRALRVTKEFADLMKQESDGITRLRLYSIGDELRVIATIDDTHQGRMLHVSASCRDRLPTWTEMIAIKRLFFPDDIAAVMVMPEEEVYVNQHAYTLHIWQLPEKWGIS